MPNNGLVLYTGTILTDEGKEKKVNIDFEPFKPINTSLYLCDNKFHTEALSELLESDNKYVPACQLNRAGQGSCVFAGSLVSGLAVVHLAASQPCMKQGRAAAATSAMQPLLSCLTVMVVVVVCLYQVWLHHHGRQRDAIWGPVREHTQRAPQVLRGPAEEARQGGAVGTPLCAAAHGEATQLCP